MNFSSILSRLLGLALLLAFAAKASSDMLLSSFPVAERVFSESRAVPEHLFVASSFSSSRGKLQGSALYSLKGEMTRETWEIPRLHEADDVMEFYVQAVQEMGGKELFRCRARDCGRSNDWANVAFKRANLYGPDRNQRYLAAVVPRAGAAPMAIGVYVIRRGNQRLYVHLEQVAVESGLGPLLASLETQREVFFSAAMVNQPRRLEQRLSDWLSNAQSLNGEFRVYVVSYHRGARQSSQDNLRVAQQQADTLKSWLITRRIPENRIQTVVVGPWGPDEVYAHSPGHMGLYLDEHENGPETETP